MESTYWRRRTVGPGSGKGVVGGAAGLILGLIAIDFAAGAFARADGFHAPPHRTGLPAE